MKDRFFYAAIAAFFGGILGAVLYLLFILRFTTHKIGPIENNVLTWIELGAAVFAVIGFLFKENAGSITGDAMGGVAELSTDHQLHFPSWLIIITTLVTVILFWGAYKIFTL